MIKTVQSKYRDFTFKESDDFMWSFQDKTIHFVPSKMETPTGKYSLLHELSHALLEHKTYDHDIDLLKYELDAWEKAKTVAKELGVVIDQDHIEDCLDSYRDWLKKRSTCPDCSFVNFQTSHSSYDCFNCGCSWRVPVSQVCRIQRRKVKI